MTLIGLTERGICHLSFIERGFEDALAQLRAGWRNAAFIEDSSATGALVEPVFSLSHNPTPIPVYLTGTNFQIKVWEALLGIPNGETSTYEQIAIQIGTPKAVRAVGTAVGHNPIAFLLPCHRVIRKTGEIGNYRYGPARKKALLGWEAAHANQ